MKTFRQKGLQFEITISKLLSSWLDSELGTNELHFWRTHGSGSVQTKVKNVSPDFFSGDIVPLTEASKKYFKNILVECKNTELTDSFLRNNFLPSQLDEFLQKLYHQMKEKEKKYGMLFIKRNRGVIWCVVITDRDSVTAQLDAFFELKIYDRRKEYVILITDLNKLISNYKFSSFFLNFI